MFNGRNLIVRLEHKGNIDMDTIISNVWGALHNATSSYQIVQVKSKVDGKKYNVRDMPDKHQAADLLAGVRQKLEKLISESDEEIKQALLETKNKIQSTKFDKKEFIKLEQLHKGLIV